MSERPEKDEITGVETTGHDWDGIKELNNPLPRWWVWVWLVTIVWSLGYYVFYPSMPTATGYIKGIDEWSSREEVLKEVAELKQTQAVYRDKIQSANFETIINDQELYEFAYRGGKSSFGLFCSQCHGMGAAGAVGIANLNDDDWIWGGKIDDIYTTIRHGVRDDNDLDSRYAIMPSFVKDGMITESDAKDIANYVIGLANNMAQGNDNGEMKFAENCATCHGVQGEGLRDMGGPRLNDAIWLYHGGVDAVYQQILNPRHGMMPAWEGRLDPVTIKQLAIYVHSLGGGEN